jgi:hypothetical protein
MNATGNRPNTGGSEGQKWGTSWKAALIATLLATLLATVSSYALNYWLQSRYPIVQTTRILPETVDSHLGKLRDDYPPLAYMIQRTDYIPEHGVGFLNLDRIPLTYLCTVGVANLSPSEIADITITIQYDGPAKFLCLRPISCPLELKPGDKLTKPETFLWLRDSQSPVTCSIATLKPGQGHYLQVGVATDKTFDPDKLKVTIRCPEGTFKQITPKQWNELGWH